MGRVYIVVLVILGAALVWALMPDDRGPLESDPAIGVGPPGR